MPLRLKIRSFQTVRRSNGKRANILFSVFPDVETNIFMGNKNTPISAINDAVILLKTRKARERRLRAATRALSVLQLALRRAHTATGVDVSRRNLSISAIENSGLRSALQGCKRPRLTSRSNVAGLTSRASAASTRVSASFGASKNILSFLMRRRWRTSAHQKTDTTIWKLSELTPLLFS